MKTPTSPTHLPLPLLSPFLLLPRTTGYEEEADDSCISRMVIRHSVKERTLVLGDMQNDPTLARSTDVQCANCGAREAVFKQEPTLQGMDLYFQCVQCRHEWAERCS